MKKLLITLFVILLLANLGLWLWIKSVPSENAAQTQQLSETTASQINTSSGSQLKPQASTLTPSVNSAPAQSPLDNIPSTQPVVYDVVLHKLEDVNLLLNEIERLPAEYINDTTNPRIALVLHGPEIAYFTRDNYPRYREMVERTAKLVAKGAVEVNVCQTRMQSMNLREEDFPDFVEFVPFGPDRVNRLQAQGYYRM